MTDPRNDAVQPPSGREGDPGAGSSEDRLTRRTLIGGAAALGAAAALPDTADAGRGHRRRKRHGQRQPAGPPAQGGGTPSADVVVVGAGLAGLSAARQIVGAGKSVIVLEARNRVGGRTLNHDLGGGKVAEVGGQWVGPTQDKIIGLAKELGIETFKTYNDGKYLYYRNGMLTPFPSNTPVGPVPPSSGDAEAEAAIVQLDQMAATVPVQAPWTAPNALQWDAQTFETWKQNNSASPEARFLLDLGVEAVWACEPRDISLLFVIFYIAAAGNEQTPGTFERLINTAGGAQDSRFVGGSQLVSLRLAQQLGGRVMLGQPVRRIVQSGGGAMVYTDDLTVKANRSVIVTGPPSLTGHIRYEPDLPTPRAQLIQRFPQGSVIKCEAVYDRPFWRDKGFAGFAESDVPPVSITFDNSPPDGTPGVLLGFIEGHDARVYGLKSPQERRAAVLSNFAALYGSEAANPRDYFEMNWSDEPWTRGCYVGFLPPGVLTDYGEAIRTPFGRIFWAGTETSDYWNGYMDGAVRSGIRAAAEALG